MMQEANRMRELLLCIGAKEDEFALYHYYILMILNCHLLISFRLQYLGHSIVRRRKILD